MSITTIRPNDLYRHMALGHHVILLDVRDQVNFERGHIKGATLYPLQSLNIEDFIHKIRLHYPTPPTIYVACASGEESKVACQKLADAEYPYLSIVEGGIRAWVDAGLPIERVRDDLFYIPPLTILQQSQLIVGSITAFGTLLATFINPGFLMIPLLIGMGFVYEGIFGTTYLEETISKLPWNQKDWQ